MSVWCLSFIYGPLPTQQRKSVENIAEAEPLGPPPDQSENDETAGPADTENINPSSNNDEASLEPHAETHRNREQLQPASAIPEQIVDMDVDQAPEQITAVQQNHHPIAEQQLPSNNGFRRSNRIKLLAWQKSLAKMVDWVPYGNNDRNSKHDTMCLNMHIK